MKYVGQFFYVVVGLMAFTTVSAQQVTVDARSITSRLDQMERRVTSVENTRFSSAGGASGGSAVADLELRLQDLEQENAALNGAIERLSKVVVDLATKVDGYQKDIDLRLQDLESRPAGTPAATPATSHQGAGTPVAAAAVTATSPSAAASPADAADIPAGMGAQEMYSRAYGYLTATDYPQAEKWMAEFVKRYPSDKLSENGYYWLGEIRLVRNNPQAAALAFRDGLKAFPKGTKAAGSMLKLGVALNQLKKPDLAKGMWQKVVKDYPNSTEAKKAQEFLAGMPKAA